MTDAADSVAACGKVWDSPTEVAGRRKQKHNNIYSANNHKPIYHSVIFQVVGMQYSLPVMFHACGSSTEEERKHSSQDY